jgi:catechol 2,3-dioxygenase
MDFKIRRAGHVVLRVTDPVAAKDFLERVVGFQTYGQEGSFYFLTAHPVSNHHMIAVRSGRKGERLPDARQIGMVSIAYEVGSYDELRRIYQRIAQQGPAYGVKLLRTEDRGTTCGFICADHDGNLLEFYSRRSEAEAAGFAPFALRGEIDLTVPVSAAPPERAPNIRVGIRRTSHLTLRCTDVAASRQFYEEMLRLVPVAEAGGRVYLAGVPGGQPVLALEPSADAGAPLPAPKAMYGLEHFSMELTSFAELQNAYRYLKGRGVDVHHTVDHGVTNSVYCIDPDGNLIEIYHDVPRAEYANPENPFGSFGPIEDRLEETTVERAHPAR